MNKEIWISYKNKKIKVKVEDCNLFHKFKGLMFTRRERAKNLLFDFDYKSGIAIHSFFVFYNFFALWLDDKNRVVIVKKVSPFSCHVSSKIPVKRLVEIPINKKNLEILKELRLK